MAKVFVVTIEAVGSADGLEQTVVLHRLVDIQVSARRSIETG
jgi:hypothetical protein